MTMARREDSDDFNDDFDDEPDGDADVDDDVMPCPYCGAEIYEDAVRCPECDEYLSDAERTTTAQPRWVIATAVIVLAALLWAFLRGG
jgi:hypothetical protein